MIPFKEEDFTPWFEHNQQPVRPGVYQRQFGSGVRYAKFSEGHWYLSKETPKEAETETFFTHRHAPWRGLTREMS